MFKLNKAELKKIFLRPAVYVMLFLLSAALVISAFMYSPAPRANPTTNFGGANETISMAFSAFKTSSSEDAKPALDAALANAKETVEGFAAQSKARGCARSERNFCFCAGAWRDRGTGNRAIGTPRRICCRVNYRIFPYSIRREGIIGNVYTDFILGFVTEINLCFNV